jgi:hypothetical protein
MVPLLQNTNTSEATQTETTQPQEIQETSSSFFDFFKKIQENLEKKDK